uniref:Uncharacterized protein n=1 Tax=Rhizophora mucronata TaxID=61149 RepID=A0A2P2P441_RHIMU
MVLRGGTDEVYITCAMFCVN